MLVTLLSKKGDQSKAYAVRYTALKIGLENIGKQVNLSF
jgi:hypothetical protein